MIESPRWHKVSYPYNNKGRCRWCNGVLTGKQRLWDCDECKYSYYYLCGYNIKAILYEINKKKNNGIVRCCKCNKEVAYDECNADHIKPISLGGKNELNNLQILCLTCHHEKTKQDLKIFRHHKKKSKTLNEFGITI